MASLAFYASPFQGATSDESSKPEPHKRDEDVRAIISKIHDAKGGGKEKKHMGDFNPPPKPQISREQGRQGIPGDSHGGPVAASSVPEESHSVPSDVLSAHQSPSMMPHWMPQANTTVMENRRDSKDELLKKINYMIHLLEEQKDARTDHVAEELILYSFIGVFVIFVVDGFARAGKYVRRLD